jgi:hypothetical protein
MLSTEERITFTHELMNGYTHLYKSYLTGN